MILALLGAAASPAWADESARAWETLHDGRLIEVADGTPEVAVRYYQDLLADMGPDASLRGPVSYALGRARLALDDPDGAVQALRVAEEDPATREDARALLLQVELRRREVAALPVTWTFDAGPGGLVHGGDGSRGETALRRVGENVLLAWETVVRHGETDQLVARFASGVEMREVRFRVRASAFPAVLRVAASDGRGGRFAAPAFPVPVDRWAEVAVRAAEMRAVDPAPGTGSPAGVRSLLLEDVTGLASSDRGANTFLIDDVEIR